MRHPADRLAALPDAAFASFAEQLGGVWPEYEASVSPVSPEGTVELSLVRDRGRPAERREPNRAVVRLCRSDVDVEAVNDLAVVVAERGLSFAVLATVGEVTADATRRARTAPVDVYDGVGLVSLARDAGIDIPGGTGTDQDHEREPGT